MFPLSATCKTNCYADGVTGQEVVVCLHGNSSSHSVFQPLDIFAARNYRLVRIDLHGHGESPDLPPENEALYTLLGHAESVSTYIENNFPAKKVHLLGHSLGGHVALHVLAINPKLIASVIVTGTPPLSIDRDCLQSAFLPSAAFQLTGKKESFTPEEARMYLIANGIDPTSCLVNAAVRAHGLARSVIVHSIQEGRRLDEVQVIRDASVPVLLVNGRNDQLVNLSYISSLKLGDRCTVVEMDSGHTPFYEHPEEFLSIMQVFLDQSKETR